MTNLGAAYLMMAKRALLSDDEPTPIPQTDTVVRMCQGDCMQHTPHIIKAGYSECVICQNRIYPRITHHYDQTTQPTPENYDNG